MPPVTKKRVGTGSMYADNTTRTALAQANRGARRSFLPRLNNRNRLWLQEEHKPGEPWSSRECREYLDDVLAGVEAVMLDLRDVGAAMTWSARMRERMPAEFCDNFADTISWFVMLHLLGIIDRRGAPIPVRRVH
jgi:hypothetical protein